MKQPKIKYCEPNFAIGYKELNNFYIDDEIPCGINQRLTLGSNEQAIESGFIFLNKRRRK